MGIFPNPINIPDRDRLLTKFTVVNLYSSGDDRAENPRLSRERDGRLKKKYTIKSARCIMECKCRSIRQGLRSFGPLICLRSRKVYSLIDRLRNSSSDNDATLSRHCNAHKKQYFCLRTGFAVEILIFIFNHRGRALRKYIFLFNK